ncbi:RimK family alpha-L-glutamate ligase [Candidatus Woesearchaeota archaeon]|nr:RimK family alpha-L-glutamate ligase [Candidatus Woesearchaeota archaeon]
MKAAIISLGSKSSAMLAKAMKNYFGHVDMLDLRKIEVSLAQRMKVLYEGKDMGQYDCIYAKGSHRYEQLLRTITSGLYDTAYMPIKPVAFSIAHDKIYTQLDIQKNRIPMPTTYITSTITAARNILKKANYPIIMKFPHGTQGKGVMFADSFASASSILDALDRLRQPFLIQEYVETGGVDIRLIVVGDKVIAGMKRKAELGEKRANIHAGGRGEAYLPDAYAKKIAVAAAKSVGADICAVDMLEDVKGPVVIEINVSPGLQGIIEATEIDVADKIAKYLADKTRERMDKLKGKEAVDIMKDINVGEGQDVITNVDLRGNRILLPEVASKLARIKEDQEICMTIKNGEIKITKY